MDYLLVAIIAFGSIFLGMVLGARFRNRRKK